MNLIAWIMFILCTPIALQRWWWALNGAISKPTSWVVLLVSTMLATVSAAHLWGGLTFGI